MRIYLSALFALLVALPISTDCWAEPAATPTPTREQREEGQKMMQKLQRSIGTYRLELSKAERMAKESKIKRLSSRKQDLVIMHVKGENGLEFLLPEKKEVDPEFVKKFKAEAERMFKESMSDYIAQKTKKERVTVCEKDVRRVVKKVAKDDKRRGKFKDVLFITKSLAQEDNKVAFGEETKVVELEDKNLTGYQALVAQFGLTCLPLRIHLGPKGFEQLEGLLALKNYDDDKKEGELDSSVERAWQQFKRSAVLERLETETESDKSAR